ncbi:MAG: triphosphoribosyl-dephospho-CoA synthase [Deltaproteobacteria bacterium]
MSGALPQPAIAAAYLTACRLEVRALKPGNVHVFAAGHRMSVADFDTSAEVSAPLVCDPALPVGKRIRCSVEATFAAVAQNTNLGILLLCAPLAAAAEHPSPAILADSLKAILSALTHDDAVDVYSAIAHANPAGLGTANAGDVRAAPPAHWTLLDAMRAAAANDMIAAEYATAFAGVLKAAAQFTAERRAGATPENALSFVFLQHLANRPDTHIVRKHGPAMAARVQTRAAAVLSSFGNVRATSLATRRHHDQLMALDSELKSWDANPGSLADLMCAAAFAANLEELAVNTRAD